MRVTFTASDRSISLFYAGRMYNIPSSAGGFAELKEHLKQKEHDAKVIERFVDRPKAIARMTAGLVQVIDNEVLYDGEVVHDALSTKLISMLNEGFDVTPWVNFMHRIKLNPSLESQTNLFRFLEKFQAPITEDGHFLAFKRVKSNFLDIYSGTFDNSPGKVVEVERGKVDSNHRNTCSFGLHVAASIYLDSYADAHSSKTIVVKIDPMDVVAVPPDYNDSKMRVCKYLVLGETEIGSIKKIESQVVATTANTPVQNGAELTNVADIARIATERLAKKVEASTAPLVFRDGFGSTVTVEEFLKASALVAGSPAKLAVKYGVARSTIRRWIDKAQETKAKNIAADLAANRPDSNLKPTGSADVFWQAGNRKFKTAEEVVKKAAEFNSTKAFANEVDVAASTARRWLEKAKISLAAKGK